MLYEILAAARRRFAQQRYPRPFLLPDEASARPCPGGRSALDCAWHCLNDVPMGLTIHYEIKAPPGWSREVVKAKLEEARQFALGLPVSSVSGPTEFQGDQARCEHGGGAGKVRKDPFYWAKAQAARTIARPQQPDTYAQQAPDRMVVFSVRPAEGASNERRSLRLSRVRMAS